MRAIERRGVRTTMSGALPVLLALVLMGCGASTPTAPPTTGALASPTPTPAPTPTPSPAPPTWSDCGGGFECTSIVVPQDYADPSGPQLRIAMIRLLATDPARRLGSLVVNPGGPGESGIDFVRQAATSLIPASVRARFDIVGFDPRGVGASSPLECHANLDQLVAVDPAPDTPSQLASLESADQAFAAACSQAGAAELAHLDTLDTARDLDRIRAALGDPLLTYLGYSYGTYLGARYASLYPDHIRALVLDGAVDPGLGLDGRLAGQAAGFEGALDRFLADCSAHPSCAFHSGGHAAAAFDALARRIEATPLPARLLTDPRPVTSGYFWSAVLAALYRQSSWPILAQALALGARGDGSYFLAIADPNNGRKPNGEYTNVIDANAAIDCADLPAPADPADVERLAAQLSRAAPRVGRVVAYTALTCTYWPYHPTQAPGPASAPGAPPILVVGSTGDPATPYPWAQALVHQLAPAGVLLTRRGEGHTSYGQGDRCIDAAVDAYLLSLTAPAAGTSCP